MADPKPLGPRRKPPTRVTSGADLAQKTSFDKYREPEPLRNHLDSEQGEEGDKTLLAIPAPDSASTEITVNPEDGTATSEQGGAIILDFSGGQQLRMRQRDRERSGPRRFDENLANDDRLNTASIAAMLLEAIRADNEARREWEEAGNRGAELLGVKWEEASAEVSAEGFVARCHHPLLLLSMVKSWAMARAEWLPASGPVKVKDDMPAMEQMGAGMMGHNGGPPMTPDKPPGSKPTRSALADALQKDMNHYLTSVDKEYYADTSRMIMMRTLKGSQFKKVYWEPLLRRPVSRWVQGTNLIVSNDASHLSGASRITEYSRVRQAIVRRLQRTGFWRDCLLVEPSAQVTMTEQTLGLIEGVNPVPQLPADFPHHIYECYCELDSGPLARDETGYTPGFPLPYVVTIDKDSETILAIRRHWKEGDPDYRAKPRYVHYGMVPGLGFYHWGYFHILGSPQRAATALLRLGIDSEMFASFPGGIIRKNPGARTQTTQFRPAPGQFLPVDTSGSPIADFVKEWPYKGMSAGLLPMLQHMEELGKELSGAVELPVGEGRVGDVPVGTIMAYVDSITRVPSAIHKDDHMSQAEEFSLLKECFEDDPKSLVSEDGNSQWTEEALRDQKLVPAADPNTPSGVHRVMQATAEVQLAGLPQFEGIADNRAIYKDAMLALGRNPDEVTLPVQPQAQGPDPKALEAAAKIQAQQDKTRLGFAQLQQKQQDTQRSAAAEATEAEQRAQDRASQERIEGMRLAGQELSARREHQRDMLGHALDHTQHLQTLAQEDRHHAQDMAHETQQGMMAAAQKAQQPQGEAE